MTPTRFKRRTIVSLSLLAWLALSQPLNPTICAWAQDPAQSPNFSQNLGPGQNTARVIDPNDITELRLGRAAFEAHSYDQALQHLYQFRDVRPNNLAVHFWLALTLSTMGRDQEATDEYVKCVNLSASIGLDSAEMRNNLGALLMRTGYTKEPLFDYKRACAIDPRCPPPYLGLAKCMIDAGNFDQALAALTNYQKAGGQDINAILLHGLALAGKDQYAPAKQDLTNFINYAQNGNNNGPLDKDLTSAKLKYVTTGSVNPLAIDLARRVLDEMQHRQ